MVTTHPDTTLLIWSILDHLILMNKLIVGPLSESLRGVVVGGHSCSVIIYYSIHVDVIVFIETSRGRYLKSLLTCSIYFPIGCHMFTLDFRNKIRGRRGHELTRNRRAVHERAAEVARHALYEIMQCSTKLGQPNASFPYNHFYSPPPPIHEQLYGTHIQI